MTNTIIHLLTVFVIFSVILLVYDQQNAFGLFSEVTTIHDPNPYPDKREDFGYDLAISDDVLVVGSPAFPIEEGGPTGAVYVYERNQGGSNNWGQTDLILNPNPGPGWDFGRAVSIYGDTFVSSTYPGRQGQIHIYEKNSASDWTLIQSLEPPDPDVATIDFGYDVSIFDDTIVVGEPSNYEFVDGELGVVRIFERSSTNPNHWDFVQSVVPSDDDYHSFGQQVFVSGDVFAASARHSDGTMSVYVFERNQTNTWVQVDKLILPVIPDVGQEIIISISGDALVVSNQFDSSEQENQGAVYVYEKNHDTNNWDLVTSLIADDDHEPQRQFGLDVSIFDDVIAVGTPYSMNGQLVGAVYIFERDSNNWNKTEILNSPDPVLGTFGKKLSMSDDLLAIAETDTGTPSSASSVSTNIHIFQVESEVNPGQCEPDTCSDIQHLWELVMILIAIIIFLLLIIGILILLRRR